MYESTFGGSITWLFSTVMGHRYHIACRQLVVLTGIHGLMILYSGFSTYLRFLSPGCERLFERQRDSGLKAFTHGTVDIWSQRRSQKKKKGKERTTR